LWQGRGHSLPDWQQWRRDGRRRGEGEGERGRRREK